MSDDGYEEATPEQKRQIAAYFIASSPVDEVDDVVSDVSKLINDESVMNRQSLTGMLRSWNEDNLVSAETPSGDEKLIVSSIGHIGNDKYVNPTDGSVLKFDHIKRVFIGAADEQQELNEDINGYRQAIAEGMDAYKKRCFKAGKGATVVYGDDSGKITICVSAKNSNLKNFWAGSWRSVYTVDVKDKGTTKLTGNTKVMVHYFEDGNVQLHCEINNEESINVTDEASSTADAISKAIEKCETAFQSNLEEMYVDMHDSTFKAMRRFLPKTQQPMNWNAHANSLASELSGK